MKTNKRLSKRQSTILLLLLLLIIGLLTYIGYQYYLQIPPPPPEGSLTNNNEPSESSIFSQNSPIKEEIPLHIQRYDLDTFGPDEERISYQNQSLILEVPRLNFKAAVLEGMTEEIKNGGILDSAMDETVLDNGVVLFNQSLLPGVENRNVSIAGHRDIHGKEFYYINTITDGDLLYLFYNGKRYTYLYTETNITGPMDWTYVGITEFSTLTLQSCTPINLATERIFVTAHLIDVETLITEEILALQQEFPSFSGTETYTTLDDSLESFEGERATA